MLAFFLIRFFQALQTYLAYQLYELGYLFRFRSGDIYCFQFSDGDNWGEDNERAFDILREKILPHVNLYCYGQVESPYGSGEYLGHLEGRFGDKYDTLVTAEMEDRAESLSPGHLCRRHRH